MKTLLIFLLIISLQSGIAQDKDVHPLPLGSDAPDFHLPATDGNMYSLNDFQDYPVLAAIFTCNHCPTAQAYEDRLIQMIEEYRPRGVGFVAISPNDPDAVSLSELGYSDINDRLDEMKYRADQKGYNFTYLYDGEDQKASIAYGPAATPHVFIFDNRRKLRYRGRIDDTENPYLQPRKEDMKEALDALLEGGPVSTPETKTFGCSTKWSWKNEWIQAEKERWSQEPVSLLELELKDVETLRQNDSEKWRLINVWATWCGPCLIEFPEFVDINRMYRNRKFEFVSISTDKLGQRDKALELLEGFEASGTNYRFAGDNIYELIEAIDPDWQGALPYTLLIEPGGQIIYKTQGMINPLELKTTIVNSLGRFYADD